MQKTREQFQISPIMTAPSRKTILCLPEVQTPLSHVELDKYKVVAATVGSWSHPYSGKSVKLDLATLEDIRDKWNKYRQHVEVTTPNGHTRDPLKTLGYLDPAYEANIVDVEFRGEQTKGIQFTVDLRDSDAKKSASNKTLRGRSIALDEDFRLSHPDGSVEKLGLFIDHLAWTSNPVLSGLPELEPVVEFSKDGNTEFQFVPLVDKQFASRMVTWQDPPQDVAGGERKATHQECGYTAGTPDQNCSRCLSYIRKYDEKSDAFASSCAWVADPILEPGVCKYFRPRTYSFDTNDETMSQAVLEFAKTWEEKKLGKHGKSASRKLDKDVNSAPNDTEVEKDSMKELNEMDLKQLAKELGVAEPNEKTEPKEFAAQIASAIEQKSILSFAKDKLGVEAQSLDKLPEAVTSKFTPKTETAKPDTAKVILGFAKEAFGVEVDAVEKVKDAVSAKFTKKEGDPITDPAVLSRLTEFERKSDELKIELDKTNARNTELERQHRLDEVKTDLSTIERRIEKAQASGRMDKAEVTTLLSLGKDDKGQERSFSLAFDRKGASYDDKSWQANSSQISFYLDKVETREAHSRVPEEKTKTLLSRFPSPDPDDEQAFDPKAELAKGKKRAEELRGSTRAQA